MKFFIDTEFIEGFHKPLFGKRRHFIDLISIGIVSEEGDTLHLISNEYNYKDADQWVKDNVIRPLYNQTVYGYARNHFSITNFHKHYGISNKQIRDKVLKMVWKEAWKKWGGLPSDELEFIERGVKYGWNTGTPIEFYGYYSDYDWVLFCSLFGRMIDLPKRFPMYCNDLKQSLDEIATNLDQIDLTFTVCNEVGSKWNISQPMPSDVMSVKDYPLTIKLDLIKSQPGYPKQVNEHNALSDAKWNYELYKFIQTLK